MSQAVLQAPVLSPEPEPLWQFVQADRSHTDRALLERIVRRRYWSEHKARGCHFLDHLLCVSGQSASPKAVLAIGEASATPMFLESYLDESIDRAIARASGQPVDRHGVVEIGNLASCDGSAATLLLMLTVSWLDGYRADWGVFTATRTVRLRLRCLGVPLFDLGTADPSRLGPVAAEWGDYYEAHPKVVAARFVDARPMLDRIPAEFAELAGQVRDAGAVTRLAEESRR